jgi:RsmE family RNA methyltransferase
MGVRNIFVVGAKKVEKSYFSMHLLREAEYRPVLIEGLMQGKTTQVPQVVIVPQLRLLWEQLPADATLRLLANPATEQPTITASAGFPVIAIGPDGGWTEQENAAFAEHGFLPITLGERPLRTDTAAIALPAVVQDRLQFR